MDQATPPSRAPAAASILYLFHTTYRRIRDDDLWPAKQPEVEGKEETADETEEAEQEEGDKVESADDDDEEEDD